MILERPLMRPKSYFTHHTYDVISFLLASFLKVKFKGFSDYCTDVFRIFPVTLVPQCYIFDLH